MMIHDTLCRFSKKKAADDHYDDCEYCELINKARTTTAETSYKNGFAAGYSDALDGVTNTIARFVEERYKTHGLSEAENELLDDVVDAAINIHRGVR